MSQWILDPTTIPGFKRLHRTPLQDTVVQGVESGREGRVGRYLTQRWRYEPEFEMLRTVGAFTELQQILNFFARHGGRRDSFLLDDPDDSTVTDQGFGVGDGATTAFQLQRTLGGNVKDILGTWPTYTKPRTNACLQSQAFDNAAWTRRASHVVTTPNAAIAPDGTLTADLVTATAPAANAGVYQDIVAANGAWTASVWLKAGTLTTAQLCVKDRATDTVRGTVNVTMTGAWQRVSVSGTTVGASAGLRLEWNGITSNGTFYVWQAQAELAAAATRDIVTVAAAVRADPLYFPSVGDGFEPVTDLDWSSVTILKDGVAQAPGTAFTYTAAGAVTFLVAPAVGAALSWTGNFFRRVRIDNDEPRFEQILPGYFRGPFEMISVL